MKAPRKLERWEVARVTKLLSDEIYSRSQGLDNPDYWIGDPADRKALETAIEILHWHTKRHG